MAVRILSLRKRLARTAKHSRVVLVALSLLVITGIFLFSRPTDRNTKFSPDQLLAQTASKHAGHLGNNVSPGGVKVDQVTHTLLETTYGKLPMQFEVNEGQVSSDVKFLSRGRGYTLFLTSTDAVLSLRKIEGNRASAGEPGSLPGNRNDDVGKLETEVVRMKLVGANQRARISGSEELPGKVNYFKGNDPKNWRTNISTYQKVKYESVYPGVDVVYYGNHRQLEYDFVVSPQSDPGSIQLTFDGAQHLRIDESGALILKTRSGEEIKQHKPIIYQEIDGRRNQIAGNYILQGRNAVGFAIEGYDKTKALVIDPILSYSTFLGGGVDDLAHGIAVDTNGNAYVTGQTTSLNFPTAGAIQPTYNPAFGYDVFVTKLNASGTALLYSTYLGGQQFDRAARIAVDSNGQAGITGQTQSSDFPRKDPLQPEKGVGLDAFVAKLSAGGNALIYSTFLGGSANDDQGTGIVFDTTGSAYVAGRTSSDNFPVLGTLDGSRNGANDAFVTKINGVGALIYSGFIGGSLMDSGAGIDIDLQNNAYITGSTNSNDFPRSINPYQNQIGGSFDCFVTKVNAQGSALVYSTYLGKAGSDVCTDIKVDDSSTNAYVTGSTSSINFPIILPAAQKDHAGFSDGFVTKFNAAGNQPVSSTFIGGSEDDSPRGLALDSSGNAYVVGQTVSPDFPVLNALQSIPGSLFDAFVTKVNSSGSAFVYSTYLGGGGSDDLKGIAAGTNSAYICGNTDLDFPTTPGAFQGTHAPPTSSSPSKNDAVVAKILEGTNPSYFAIKGIFTNPNGSPVEGVRINLSGAQSKTTITNSEGEYIFQLLPALEDYTVAPDTPIPTQQGQWIFNALSNNVTTANFTATQAVLTISGRLSTINQVGLSGFQVELSGSSDQLTTTNWNGVFSFLVPTGGTYTVTPDDSQVTNWSPPGMVDITRNSITLHSLSQNSTDNHFQARTPQFTVAGRVKNSSDAALEAVQVRQAIPGFSAGTVFLPTNGTGNYNTVPLPSQGDYVLTPQPFTVGGTTYNVFSPAQRTFIYSANCVQANLPPNTFCSGSDYADMDFTAFTSAQVVPVAVTTVPAGLTVSIDGGAPVTSPQFVNWLPGSVHTIATTSPQSETSGTRLVWNNWSDGGAISHTVTTPAVATGYTANFTTQHQLTMFTAPGGTVLPANGSFFNEGQSVQISATPDSGFIFAGWSGSGNGSFSGSTNPVNVTMNGPVTQTANFTQTVQMTIQTVPAGRTVSIDGGAAVTAPVNVQWVPGSQHTIATTSPQAGTTGTQYVWSNWSDGGAISHTVTAPGVATTYTANFTTQHQLTMVAGSGGTVLPASGSFFNQGQSVQISATPNSGFSFGSWTGLGSGSFTGSTNPVNVTMNGPITQTASFTQNPVQMTIQTVPAGRTVSIDGGAAVTAPVNVQWVPGSQHTIATTSPQAGTTGTQYVWSNWSDGGAISHTVTAPGVATTYTANFTTQHQLTMVAGAGGTVLPASGSFFNQGQSVQISATPNSGFSFGSWTGSGSGSFSGSTNPVNVTMNGPITQTASFTQNAGITIQTVPAGRTVSIDGGAAVTAPVNVQWTPGSQHTIATTSPQADTAGTQYVWSNWSDGGAISHSVTAPAVATTYTANFTTQHQLTMVAGSGGTVLPASGSFFNQGQSVQITATPNVGFVFSGWSGTGTGSFTGATNPVSITMNGPITQTAAFAAANSIQFSSGAVSQTEDGKQISVTVNRSNSTASASVDYTTSDTAGVALCHVIANVASSRCDYLITLGTIQFAAGESTKTINIPIVDDVYAEGSETFAISLSNPVGATLGSPSTAQLTITDNETSNGTNPINTASFFVRQHYLDFLNREPDAGGLNFWSDQITSCGTDTPCIEVKRINVSAAFFLSIEFQETGYLVYRSYKTAFGNLPGGAPVPVRFIDFLRDTQQIGKGVQVGATGWEAQLEANKQAFALAFVQRTDFQTAFPDTMTAEQFVTALDTNAGSVLSVAEKANLIAVLGATPADIAKRASVLRSVAEDADLKNMESNKAFVLMQYFGYLRRSPNDLPDSDFGGFNFWLGKLNSFHGNFVEAEMVKAFILSGEYRQRFGP